MGEIISTLVKFLCSGLSLCNSNNINVWSKCCGHEDKDEDIKSDDIDDNEESDVVFLDERYYVFHNKILKRYYVPSRIAYFKCDVNGVATQCGDNMEDFVGISREKNLQSISWVANIAEDNYEEYDKWSKSAKEKTHYVKRMHFKYKRGNEIVHRYVVVESIPIFNENKEYEGLRGVVLNLPRKIWNAFDDKGGLALS